MFASPGILDLAMPRLGFVNAMMMMMMMMMMTMMMTKLPILVCAEKLESEKTKVRLKLGLVYRTKTKN